MTPIRTLLSRLTCLLLMAGVTEVPLQAVDGAIRSVGRLERNEPLRIVCFGDSITGIYYHTGGRRAWSHLLELALRRRYPQARIEVRNAGVSGNTTTAALARMQKDVLQVAPQLVVAMFGMNDVARVKPEVFRANLREIVTRAQTAGSEVILMTPNSIYPGDPNRPPARLKEYAGIVQQVGRELNVPVADCFGAYEAVQHKDRLAWVKLMSETIHPNLRGHALMASEVAEILGARRISLSDLLPLTSEFPRLRAKLAAKQPVRILAMKPYDALMADALRALYPDADIRMTSWDVEGKSLAALEAEAKQQGWWKFRQEKNAERPDLVLLAVPADATAPTAEDFYRQYTWVMNWSLSIGLPEWDYFAIAPGVLATSMTPAQRSAEAAALDVIASSDLPVLRRTPGDPSSPARLLIQRLKTGLANP